MREHPTKQELNEYCRRVLAPSAFLSVHRHVATCPPCAAQCNSAPRLARDLAYLEEALTVDSDGEAYHLPAAQRQAYLQGALDEIDLEIAESHLSTCETCLNEVQQQAAENDRVARPQTQPLTFTPRRSLKMSAWSTRVAAAVILAALAVLFTVWLLRSRRLEHKDQAAGQASPSRTAAQVESSSPSEGLSNGPVTPHDSLPEAQLALVLNDSGSKVTLNNEGTLAGLDQLPFGLQQIVRAALQAGKVLRPDALAQLNSLPGTLLSESGDGLPFRLLSPLGQVIRTQQPAFRWRPLPGAQSYKVIVTDADLNEVATSPTLNTTEWRITQPLKQGNIYSWQVTALKDGATITSPVLPAPQAKFKIVDHSTSEMLRQAEHLSPRSHLTLGVLYGEAGLLDEAEQELRALVRQNPNAGIAHQLLRSVQAIRASQSSARR